MSDVDNIIARMIRAARAKDQTQMLEICGFSNATASAWRRRKKIPDGSIAKVANITGVSFEEIKTGKRQYAADPEVKKIVIEAQDDFDLEAIVPTEKEKGLIRLFRNLTPEKQDNIIDMVGYFAKHQQLK